MNGRSLQTVISLTALAVAAHGQGTFQNLDFEAARNLPTLGVSIATTDGLPSWAASYGTNQLLTINYNEYSGVPRVGLWDTNASLTIIGGNFSVSLAGGALAQEGLVPTNAMSIRFKAYPFFSTAAFAVSLSGQSLAIVSLSANPDYTLYGADMAAFGGQTATLRFGGGTYMLDDIEFSSEPIPEPSLLALACFGGFVLSVLLFRATRRQYLRNVEKA